MKGNLVLVAALASLILLAAVASALACWIPPPPIQHRVSLDGLFVMEVHNETGEVFIRRAPDGEDVLWKVKVPGFSPLFTSLYLINDGRTIIAVRGNHQVSGILDAAMYIVDQDGGSYAVSASQFTDRLVQSEDRSSTSPGAMWLISVVEISDEKIVVVNATGDRREVEFDLIRQWYGGKGPSSR